MKSKLTTQQRRQLIQDTWDRLRLKAIFGKVLQPGNLPEIEQRQGYELNGDGRKFFRDED